MTMPPNLHNAVKLPHLGKLHFKLYINWLSLCDIVSDRKTKALKFKCSNCNISANSGPIPVMLGLFYPMHIELPLT